MGLGDVWRSIRGRPGDRPHNLLAISDLHLGCDRKAGCSPGAGRRWPQGAGSFDAQLTEFIDWHSAHREGGKPWRLLLNGDIIDFVAITLLPQEDAGFVVRPEERTFGLAAEEAKCVWKLRRVFERHPEVFGALGRFLGEGNSVHFIRGNHDAELRFPAVQQELRAHLAALARAPGPDLGGRAAALVEFHSWFYLEAGFFYAEHGNAYDSYGVGTGFFDAAGDSAREMELPMTSKVLRYFVNGCSGAATDDADSWGLFGYLAWVLRSGNPLRVGAAFFAMVLRVLSPVVRQSLTSGPAWGPPGPDAPAGSRLRNLLGEFAGTEAQAQELLAITSRPAEQSVFGTLQLFYLDRLALALLSLAFAWTAADLAQGRWQKLAAVALGAVLFAGLNLLLGAQRRVDAHPLLLDAARRVAQVFGVRYVTMGHSHRAVSEPLGAGARYFNLGSWTCARGGEGFPHVAVVGEVAELRRWKGPPGDATQAFAADLAAR